MAQRTWVSTTLIILLVLTAGAGLYFYRSLNSDLTQLDRAHEQARAEAKRLQQELAGASERLTQRSTSADRLEARLNDAQQALANATSELEASQVQTANLEVRIQDLEARLAATEADLAQARDQLAQNQSLLAQVTEERQSVAEQYRKAREQLTLQQAQSQSAGETVKELEARLQRERSAMNNLQTRLQNLSDEKQTLVSRLEDGTTVIKLPENIVFDSGSADIGKPGRQTLQLLTTALESFPGHLISVQGHSDSRSISPSLQDRYLTNWELSAARAASAVRVLRDNGIAPERMQAVGYADTRPLVKETDAASRRMNRRIEVLLYPDRFTVKAHSGLTKR